MKKAEDDIERDKRKKKQRNTGLRGKTVNELQQVKWRQKQQRGREDRQKEWRAD